MAERQHSSLPAGPHSARISEKATIVVFQHTHEGGLNLQARLPPYALKAIRGTLLAIAGLVAAYLVAA